MIGSGTQKTSRQPCMTHKTVQRTCVHVWQIKLFICELFRHWNYFSTINVTGTIIKYDFSVLIISFLTCESHLSVTEKKGKLFFQKSTFICFRWNTILTGSARRIVIDYWRNETDLGFYRQNMQNDRSGSVNVFNEKKRCNAWLNGVTSTSNKTRSTYFFILFLFTLDIDKYSLVSKPHLQKEKV